MVVTVRSESQEALEEAVTVAGSQSALARKIRSTQGSVWRWLNGRKIPAEAAVVIERETGVAKERLRPDIFSPEPVAERTPPDAALDRRPAALSAYDEARR